MKLSSFGRWPLLKLCVGSLLLLGFTACGSSDGNEDQARVRYLHANPYYAGLTFDQGDSGDDIELGYSSITNYRDVDARNQRLQVFSAASPVAPVINYGFGADTDNTIVVAAKDEDAIEYVFINDDLEDPDDGAFKMRVLHMAPSAKGIDVHFVSPGFDVSDTIPAVDNLQYSNYSQYLTGVASSVRVVALDSLTSEVVFDSGVIVLSGDTVYKYVILDRAGGGRPLFGLLIEDKS